MRRYDVLIGGYFGYGNLGDEAILEAICNCLREKAPDISICVLSADPKATARSLGVDSVKRDSIISVARAMASSRTYISGGGSLLQDRTSRRSLAYYAMLMIAGKAVCGRACVFASGIGPLRSRSLGFASVALSCADLISARDPMACRMMSDIAGKEQKKRISLSADPAFLLDTSNSEAADGVLGMCGIGKKRFFAVSLRKTKSGVIDEVVRFCKMQKNIVPLFIAMQESEDFEVCSAAAERTGGAVLSPSSFCELVCVMKKAEFAVGIRLHFLIAAVCANIPAAALSYDCKTEGFSKYAGIEYVDVTNANSKQIQNALAHRKFAKGTDRMRAAAEKDMQTLCRFIESKEADKCEKKREANTCKSSDGC